MRSRNRPPPPRASSRLKSAVRALPRCSSPVGLGAKRVTRCRSPPGRGIALVLMTPWYGKHAKLNKAPLTAAPCSGSGGSALLAAAPCYRIRRAPRLPRRATEDSMLTQPTTRMLATLLLAMVLPAGARGEAPHSGNAQFYVNLVDNPDLDPVPTRWGYAVFGRILQGMDVIERIGEVATGSSGPFKADAPLKPIVIEKMEILAPGATAAAPLVTPVTPPRQDTILSPK